MAGKFDNKCTLHNDYDYRFICSDCRVPVCDFCIVSKNHHRSHSIDFITSENCNQIFQEFKNNNFQFLIKCLDGDKELLNKSNEIFNELEEEHIQNVNTISNEFKQLHTILDSVEKDTIKHLVTHYDENKETHSKISKKLENNSKNAHLITNKYKETINNFNIQQIFNNDQNIKGNNHQHLELLKHCHQSQMLVKEKNTENKNNDLLNEFNKVTIENSMDIVKNSIKDTFKIKLSSATYKDPKRVKLGGGEYFIYKDGCVIPNGTLYLALGPSIKNLTIGSIPATVQRIALLNGFNLQLTEGLLPNSVQWLHIGAIRKPLIKKSIPQSVSFLFLLDGFNQEISEIPPSVTQIYLGDTSFKIPQTLIKSVRVYKTPSCKQDLNGFNEVLWNSNGYSQIEM
ncbi:hypothetical protein ACTFIR_008527 [Dictyostelium discoideum]